MTTHRREVHTWLATGRPVLKGEVAIHATEQDKELINALVQAALFRTSVPLNGTLPGMPDGYYSVESLVIENSLVRCTLQWEGSDHP